MLRPLDLTYVIGDDEVLVTTVDRPARGSTQRLDVHDLIVPEQLTSAPADEEEGLATTYNP